MNSASTPSTSRLSLRIPAAIAAICALSTTLPADPLALTGDDFGGLVAMSEYEVVGTRPSVADGTTMKLDAKILETPRSVTVIDSSRIREQDFQSAADVLFWVPGINSNGDSYHFYARGFRQLPNDWKIDGFVGRVIGGSYAPNLFGVESMTVLKGPAGLLYGATTSPGGQMSLSMKKPRDTASVSIDTRIRTFAGGESSFGDEIGSEVELDATGPVTKDGRVLYRFLSSVERARLKPATPDDNQFHRLSFTAKLDTAGRYQLTPIVEWSREERTTRGAVISPLSSRTTSDGRTDYTLADATPRDVNLGAGARTDDNFTYGADFSAQLTEKWSANASFRQHSRDYTNNAWNVVTSTLTQTIAGDPHSWTIQRQHTRARTENDNTSLDLNSSREFVWNDTLKTTFLAGWNARWQDAQAYTSTTGALQSPVNTFTGLASAALIADASPVLPLGNLTKTFAWNSYLVAQTAWRERFIATISGGYTGDEVETITPAGASSTVKRRSDVTPNLGLVYLITPKIAAYTSYSTSYNLPSATAENASGQLGTFDPSEGESYEAGLKAEFWGDLLAASLSFYRTELNGVLVQSDTTDLNPNGNRYYRQLDTGRKSQGIELEFTVSPVKRRDTTFTYAYIDAHDRNRDGSRAGRAEMTPRHAFSAYTRYAITQGKFSGLSARLGFIWQGERIGGSSAPTATAPDPLTLRAFYRIDAGISYRLRNWTFALNVENITDNDYLIGGSTGLALDRANPRSLAFRTGYAW